MNSLQMHNVRMHKLLMIGLCLASLLGGKSRFDGEWAKERMDLSSCKDWTKLMGCGQTLFTGKPFHFSVGSLAPGNGFGTGLSVLDHWSSKKNWRNNWSADAVASPNGSWRAGGYVTFVWSGQPGIDVGSGRDTGSNVDNGAAEASLQEQPVIHAYSEATSLARVAFFGLGPNTKDTARSYFGIREVITGGNAVFPLKFAKRLNAALLGEAHSRLVEVRSSLGQASPSIESLYNASTAPGLSSPPGAGGQPGYAQFGEGVRIRPEIGKLRFNYLAQLQQFAAPSNSNYSFQRFTVDLGNQFALYRTTRRLRPLDHNSPNDCSMDPEDTEHKCPQVKFPTAQSRNLEGSVGVRLLIQESIVPGGHAVPFYFQPTLGGSDIGGNNALGSYQDYRFRAPNTILFRATFEHSIWGPFGAMFALDEGKVAMQRSDIDFSHLRHSYSAGLTLRAGGFPMVHLLFSWGGSEGTHITSGVNTSLLGGSSRPSLY
jgi:hypothetical protein